MKKTSLYIGLVLVVILVVSGLTFFWINGKKGSNDNVLLTQEEKVNGDNVKIEYYLDGNTIKRSIMINKKEVVGLNSVILRNVKSNTLSEAQDILKKQMSDNNADYDYLKLKDLSNNNYYIFRNVSEDLDNPEKTLTIFDNNGKKLRDFTISISPVYVKSDNCNYNRCVNISNMCVGDNQKVLFYATKGNVVVQDNSIFYVNLDDNNVVVEEKISVNNGKINIEKLGSYEVDGEDVIVGYC